jgi:hypothetical protein
VAGIHDELIDLVEQFGGEQPDVVLQRLVVIVGLVKGAVPEHFAQGIVMIDEFMQPVVVDVQIQTDDAADKDCPQAHARSAIALVFCTTRIGCSSLGFITRR